MPAIRNELLVSTQVRSLLNQEITLPQFVDWFIDAFWELDANDPDRLLAARVWNRLGGYSSGYLSDDDLISNLRDDAREFGVHVGEGTYRPVFVIYAPTPKLDPTLEAYLQRMVRVTSNAQVPQFAHASAWSDQPARKATTTRRYPIAPEHPVHGSFHRRPR